MATSKTTLAFYAPIQRREAHMAGLMVVDEMGIPLSFHHTSPLKPGGVARLLMGHKDATYFRSRVMLPPLIEALKSPPSVLFLADKATFDGIEPGAFSFPIFYLHEAQGEPMPSLGDQENLEDGGLKIQLTDVGPPTLVYGENQSQHIELLLGASVHLELLEPFHRVEQAVQTLFDQEVREGS